MLRELIRHHSKLQPEPLVAVVPDFGSVNNRVRLAQYRRKKAMKAVNPELTFPIEIYE